MRLIRASLVSLLLVCLFTGAIDAQTCTPLSDVHLTLEGAQNFCRTSTGGLFTASDTGGGTSVHQWVYGPTSSGPWTPIAGATGTTYRLNGSDFSTGLWWVAEATTPQCGSPMLSNPQAVSVYDTLPAPEIFGTEQVCADATNAVAQSAAQWDSYAWTIEHGTLVPGSNGCGDDPTKRCVSFRPDGTGEVHLSLTVTAGSCSASALRAVPLTQNAPPDLVVSSPVCAGSQTAAYTSPSPTGTRTWSVTHAHLDADYGDHIFFTPDGTGPVDVTLTFTDANGCSSTSAAQALVTGTKPVITLGSPACARGGGTASAGGGWSTYEWSITNGSIGYGQGTPNINFTASGTGPVTLSVIGRTELNTSTCSSVSDPLTIPDVPAPTITLGSATICPFGSDTATAPAGYANYWWSVTNGYISSGEYTNSITFQRGGYPNDPNDPMTITLMVADASGCGSAPATVTVPTRTIPAPAITLGTPDICPFGSDTATAPPGYANYWWSVTNGYITGGDYTNSITFQRGGFPGNPDGPITITLFVQDADGCPAPQASVTVPTRTIPAPAITLATPDVCPFGSDTATAPAGYANYWWSVTNGYVTSGDYTNSITFSPGGGTPGSGNSGPMTITLFVQDANGCPAPQSTVTVPIRTIPAPTITLAAPDVCPFGSDTATAPAGYANYWWSITNGYITSGDYTNSITFSPGSSMPGSHEPVTITLFVQDPNGCPAPQASVTVPVRTIPPPQITLATPDICQMGSDTATAPSGYANYWWSITNGYITGGNYTNAITFSPSGNGPVTLSLSVQDGDGCPVTAADVVVPIRIIAAPPITLGAPSICTNGNGTASAPPTYATYGWSITHGTILSGEITNAITFRADGTGDVTVSLVAYDNYGCTSNAGSATAVLDHADATVTASGPTTFCAGGSVTLSAPAGYASYAWSNGANGSSITVTTSGSYTVTVTTAGGCTATSAPTAVTVNPVPAIHIVAAQQYTSLAPASFVLAQVSGSTYTYCGTATVRLFATGGVSGSQYSWSTGQQTPQITVTQSGVYTATITNAEGCPASDTVTININPIPTATISASGPLDLCPNGGSVVLTANAADSYLWSNGQTTRSIVVTQPGPYHVAVTIGGCTATSADVDVTVRSSGVIAGGRTFCPGGSVTLTAPAGASYAWNTGATTQAITVSAAGDYSVTVTDAAGCSMTPPPATVVASSLAVSVTASATTICEGQTATLTANATGGTGNYSYQWFNYAGAIAGATSAIYNASANDEFYVVVTDAGGCSVSTTDHRNVLSVNPLPAGYIYFPQGSFCPGETKTVTGVPLSGVTYAWTVSNGTLQSTSGNAAVITAGASGNVTIGLTVTNSSGCSWTGTQNVPIVQPPPVPVITASGPTTFCQGDGVTLTAPPGYSYVWKLGTQVIDTSQSLTVGVAGSFTVTVTNAGGCSTTSQPVVLTVNPLPDASITAPATVCASTYGENASVPPVYGASYAWTITGGTITSANSTSTIGFKPSGSGPVTLGVTVTGANGCTASSSRTVDVRSVAKPAVTPAGVVAFCDSGLLTAPAGYAAYSWKRDGGQITGASAQTFLATQSGTYSVIVFDGANCFVESDPVTVTVSYTPVASISASASVCAGATDGAVSAGTAASYQWSVANGTLVDGQGTKVIHYTAGPSGNVTLTLTVGNGQGCSATQTTTIPISVVQATITPSGPLTICPNGNVTLTANAGSRYFWSTGAITQSITVTQGGEYWVRVFDASGCNAQSQPVSVSVASLPTTITSSGPTTFCAGGNVTLSAPAGYSSYAWSNGATTRSITVSTSDNYSVTVHDGNNCSATSSAVSVNVRQLPTATVTGGGAICPGGSSTITAALTGTAPWSVTWSDNVTQTINSGTTASRSVSPGAATTYTVLSVTDANCTGTSSGSAGVTIKTLPSATVSGGGTICPGGSSTITAALTGTAPWSVTWSDNVTQTINSGTTASRSVSPAATTTYTVTSVSDAAGCPRAGTGSAAVTVNAAASITTQPANATTTRNTNVTLSVVAAGTNPISYQWFNGNGTAISGATSNSYTTSFIKKGTNTFYVEVWNACNATHVRSNTVTVTVN